MTKPFSGDDLKPKIPFWEIPDHFRKLQLLSLKKSTTTMAKVLTLVPKDRKELLLKKASSM